MHKPTVPCTLVDISNIYIISTAAAQPRPQALAVPRAGDRQEDPGVRLRPVSTQSLELQTKVRENFTITKNTPDPFMIFVLVSQCQIFLLC